MVKEAVCSLLMVAFAIKIAIYSEIFTPSSNFANFSHPTDVSILICEFT